MGMDTRIGRPVGKYSTVQLQRQTKLNVCSIKRYDRRQRRCATAKRFSSRDRMCRKARETICANDIGRLSLGVIMSNVKILSNHDSMWSLAI
jgi:hypothetical protein